MKSNMKVILSAVGVVALLASPALAKSHERHHHHAAPSLANIPADAQASVGGPAFVVSPYSAETRTPVYAPRNNNLNPDFQLGGEQ
jgi:hypothetical protein